MMTSIYDNICIMEEKTSKTFGVYKITNKINGKIYVGSTSKSFSQRWSQWRRDLNNRFKPHYLYRSWKKYGEKSFEFSILEIIEDVEKVLEREQYWIDTLKPDYNVCPKAGSRLGSNQSEKSKTKISASLRKFYSNPDERNRKSEISKKSWANGNKGNTGHPDKKKGMRQDRKCPICNEPVKEFYKPDGSFSAYGKTCGKKECFIPIVWMKRRGVT